MGLGKKVSIQESIVMKVSSASIFDYVSNVKNDPIWRPEVARMEVNPHPEYESIIIEHITVYRFFHIITPVVVKELNRPYQFIIETPSTHPTWVHCIREIKELEKGQSIFTVTLSFSLDNLQQILPFSPPAKWVIWWYRPRIRKYLKKLKGILEHSNNGEGYL